MSRHHGMTSKWRIWNHEIQGREFGNRVRRPFCKIPAVVKRVTLKPISRTVMHCNSFLVLFIVWAFTATVRWRRGADSWRVAGSGSTVCGLHRGVRFIYPTYVPEHSQTIPYLQFRLVSNHLLSSKRSPVLFALWPFLYEGLPNSYLAQNVVSSFKSKVHPSSLRQTLDRITHN
jgi:hypothetical protein